PTAARPATCARRRSRAPHGSGAVVAWLAAARPGGSAGWAGLLRQDQLVGPGDPEPVHLVSMDDEDLTPAAKQVTAAQDRAIRGCRRTRPGWCLGRRRRHEASHPHGGPARR